MAETPVLLQPPPAELDYRTKYPSCYPQNLPSYSTETVRNQGTCGSCWAFASATTAMANLCITDVEADPSGKGKYSWNDASKSDRSEISVQKIMSCVPDAKKYTSAGCQGGNMNGFSANAARWGLTKEMDNKYGCGGGNPKNHFTQKPANCKVFPWGGACAGSPNPNWYW